MQADRPLTRREYGRRPAESVPYQVATAVRPAFGGAGRNPNTQVNDEPNLAF
jgi:hypothetical protein